MTEKLASITAKSAKLTNLLTQSAVSDPGGDPPWIHSDVYLEVSDGEVRAIVSAGGGSVLTYCTFREGYFDEIEGEAQAIVDVDATLDRLKVASDGGRMAFDFYGPEDGELAQQLKARGALEMSVTLPASEKALSKVPDGLPERFDDEERFLSPSGNPHQTYVDTRVETVEKVIDAVELDDAMEYFPITVEDGDFTLNVGDDLTYLRGDLSASSVDGPDLQNWYGPGFEALFGTTLSGDVQLQTTPGDNGGHPMAVVQESDDVVIRHVLVEVNPA
jgi:hypothetical protein